MMKMSITIIILMLLMVSKEYSSNHGAIFKQAILGWRPLCAQDTTNFTWVDAVAGEMKYFGFLVSCLSTPSCKGVQTTRHESGYYRLQSFPTTLTNIKDCQIFYRDDICMANLSSWGFDDIGAGRTDSFIEIFGGQKFTKATYVVNTVEFDPVSCSISKSRNFDTFLSQSDTYALRAYLEGLDTGTIVLGITYDEPATNLGLIMDYLISVNLNVSSIKFRGKFTFAWQKGFPEKSILSVRNGKIPLSTLVAFNREANSSTTMARIIV